MTATATKKLFEVTYRGEEQDAPTNTWRCRAFDADHAEDKFVCGSEDDGWRVLSVRQVREVLL